MSKRIDRLQDYRDNIFPDNGDVILDAATTLTALTELFDLPPLPQVLMEALLAVTERLEDAYLNGTIVRLSRDEASKIVFFSTAGTQRAYRLFNEALRQTAEMNESDIALLRLESPRELRRLLKSRDTRNDELWQYFCTFNCVRAFFDVNADFREEARTRGVEALEPWQQGNRILGERDTKIL